MITTQRNHVKNSVLEPLSVQVPAFDIFQLRPAQSTKPISQYLDPNVLLRMLMKDCEHHLKAQKSHAGFTATHYLWCESCSMRSTLASFSCEDCWACLEEICPKMMVPNRQSPSRLHSFPPLSGKASLFSKISAPKHKP